LDAKLKGKEVQIYVRQLGSPELGERP